jgi:hypothetical protein
VSKIPANDQITFGYRRQRHVKCVRRPLLGQYPCIDIGVAKRERFGSYLRETGNGGETVSEYLEYRTNISSKTCDDESGNVRMKAFYAPRLGRERGDLGPFFGKKAYRSGPMAIFCIGSPFSLPSPIAASTSHCQVRQRRTLGVGGMTVTQEFWRRICS